MTSSTVHDAAAASESEKLALDVAREMRRRWQQGDHPAAEDFLALHPHLSQQPEAAIELIYEEYCLRQSAGDEDADKDILRRFPQWAGPLRVMLDCHRRVIQVQRDRPRYPAVGERLGDFSLVAHLTRGSRGRVFLATQTPLAGRPVVLKITPLDGAEHLSLGRLQHTNIVPLFSVVDDSERGIRILCMPFFGRTTLASLLEFVATVPLTVPTGRHIVDAIDRVQEPSLSPPAIDSAARQMLASVSYVQAMCWIIACLADALHFAHERGVVHLDLKPSNILLAYDGQPMLLDFHLARAPILPGGQLPENIGGTRPYMPPEQRAAMQALAEGREIEFAVDGRADIYALGAMMYESLGGQLPITADSPPLAKVNPQVSPGLSDIVAKCVASRPDVRYASAVSLADDLRRHLTDQPLVGVRNRSITERWRKWRRRRPGRIRIAATMLVASVLLLILLAGLGWHMRDCHQQAQRALDEGRQQLLGNHDRGQAVQTFQRGLRLLENVPLAHHLRQKLDQQLATARQLHLAQQLHQFADQIRVLYGEESVPAHRRRALAAQCESFWQKRDVIMNSSASARASEVADDLRDIAIFAAFESDMPTAARILNETEIAFGPSAVLEYQRQKSHITDSKSPAQVPAPRSAWEHYALGRAYLASADLPQAQRELAAALRLDPAGCWPNFYSGLCAYRAGRYHDAVAAFSVCIGSAPRNSGCYYNRALAYAALDRTDQALGDYSRALAIDPNHATASLNRGMLHFQVGRPEQAIADLHAALTHGADPATVHYDLALVHAASNKPALALQHVRLALECNPTHSPSQQLRDMLEHKPPSGSTSP